jgi:hypothetical protein
MGGERGAQLSGHAPGLTGSIACPNVDDGYLSSITMVLEKSKRNFWKFSKY